jgi:hypothetical protein
MIKRRQKISGSPRLRLKTLLASRKAVAAAIITVIALITLLTYSNFFSSVDSKATGANATNSKNLSPNKLVYFKATPTSGNAILLEWASFAEIGKDYYTIDRSADSINFSAIGIVQIQVNSSSQLSYSYVDTQPLEGPNYYRLRQTDYRGWCEPFEKIPVATIEQNQMVAQLNSTRQATVQ